jgi:hypothetical protein
MANIALEVRPEPAAVRALTFDDAPSPSPWVMTLIVFAFLLWFVVSTWSHRETRAYLARETPLKR